MLGTLIVFCFLGTSYTEKSTEQMRYVLDKAFSSAKEDNWQDAIEYTKEAEEKWEEFYKKLSLYMTHAKLDSISQNLACLGPLAAYQAEDQFYAEILRCQSQITGLGKTEYPTVDNIL